VSFGAGLLEANVVDELQFYVNPYAVRSGRSIFRQPRPLQCIDATAYPCGIVVQRYRPASWQPHDRTALTRQEPLA